MVGTIDPKWFDLEIGEEPPGYLLTYYEKGKQGRTEFYRTAKEVFDAAKNYCAEGLGRVVALHKLKVMGVFHGSMYSKKTPEGLKVFVGDELKDHGDTES